MPPAPPPALPRPSPAYRRVARPMVPGIGLTGSDDSLTGGLTALNARLVHDGSIATLARDPSPDRLPHPRDARKTTV